MGVGLRRPGSPLVRRVSRCRLIWGPSLRCPSRQKESLSLPESVGGEKPSDRVAERTRHWPPWMGVVLDLPGLIHEHKNTRV
jgi:hypothetical protein